MSSSTLVSSLVRASASVALGVCVLAAALILCTPAGSAREVRLDHRITPSPSRGTVIAKVLIRSAVRAEPDGRPVWVAMGRTRLSGSPQRLMVLAPRERAGRTWLKVRLPVRPNSASGWIPLNRVELIRSRSFVDLDRSRRIIRVFSGGERVARFRVVVGAPETPTPIGLFALYDLVAQPSARGFIGPWAIHLTAHSNVLHRYDGGSGRIALHGRAGASLLDPLGSARSHGCIRMTNRRISWLTGLSLGTAILVHP
ncbi:MAG TPA: L,D-transpeptidase [Solirubrobacterales bacterium]|nr:L,D-transpeptidase [Solirubrobacterales bacterium]